MTAYWINTFRSISDRDKLAAYVDLAGPAMRSAGGTFLARGLPAAAFESGIVERTTLIEFRHDGTRLLTRTVAMDGTTSDVRGTTPEARVLRRKMSA